MDFWCALVGCRESVKGELKSAGNLSELPCRKQHILPKLSPKSHQPLHLVIFVNKSKAQLLEKWGYEMSVALATRLYKFNICFCFLRATEMCAYLFRDETLPDFDNGKAERGEYAPKLEKRN